MVACFLPAMSVKGSSLGGVSAIGFLFGDTEAKLLDLAFIDEEIVFNLGGMQGIMEIGILVVGGFIVLSALGMAIGMLQFNKGAKKKAHDGTLVIKHFVRYKYFVHPVRLVNTASTALSIFATVPWIIQLIFKGDGLEFAVYVLVVAITLLVLSIMVESIIISIVKKELDSMTDDEVASLFATGQALYAESTAAKNANEGYARSVNASTQNVNSAD